MKIGHILGSALLTSGLIAGGVIWSQNPSLTDALIPVGLIAAGALSCLGTLLKRRRQAPPPPPPGQIQQVPGGIGALFVPQFWGWLNPLPPPPSHVSNVVILSPPSSPRPCRV